MVNRMKVALAIGFVLVGSSAVFGLGKWSEAREKAAVSREKNDRLESAVDQMRRADGFIKAYASAQESDPKHEIVLYDQASAALENVISAMKEKGDGRLGSAQVSQMMSQLHALPEYSRMYKLLGHVSGAVWQLKSSDERLASFRAELEGLQKDIEKQSIMSVVCSQAFGQEEGKILMGCMDVGSARRVVLLVDSAVYANASYPLNGRFAVVSRGVRQYTMTNANAFNTWQSTEMVPTFEAINFDSADEGRKRAFEINNTITAEIQKTKDALVLLHNAMKAYAKQGVVAGGESGYVGYSSLLVDIRYSDATNVDFENMVYPASDGKISLKAGEFRDDEMATSYRFNGFKRFDANADGSEDYVVTLVANYGGMMPSDNFIHYLAVREGGRLRVIDLGYDEASISEAAIEGRSIVITPLVYGNNFSEVDGEDRDYRVHRASDDQSTVYTWKNFQIEKSPSKAI